MDTRSRRNKDVISGIPLGPDRNQALIYPTVQQTDHVKDNFSHMLDSDT